MPNLDEINIDTISEFLHVYKKEKVFGEAPIAIIPCNIRTMNKEKVEIFYKKILATVRKGGE